MTEWERATNAAFAAAGVTGTFHAVDIDTGAEVGGAADVPVVAASVFKLPILVEFCRQVHEGVLDPTAQLQVPAGGRTLGPTGLSVMQDGAQLSLRDLAYLMMSVSDNHATDLLLHTVGRERVNATMRSLGLPGTVLEGDCAYLFETITADLGTDYDTFVDQYQRDRDHDRLTSIRALTPGATNRTTAREATSLLRGLWRDELVAPPAAAEARRILRLQVWTNRLTAGFPEPGTRVCGKTGTILDRRCEAGVVELANGRRFAVAVFVVHPDPYPRQPAADAVIGQVARLAVDHLTAG